MSENTIELDNVGPIQHLEIPIPEEGGLVVLRGRNGSGKSHALNGVESLAKPATRRGLEKSDNAKEGTIEGLGVRVRLGRSNTARGELLVDSLEGKVDPSIFVDPGLKDPEKADRRRLETLVQMGGVKVDKSEWIKAAGRFSENIGAADLVSDDPVETANRLRLRMHEHARSIERTRDSKLGEAKGIRDSNVDVDDKTQFDADALQEAYDAASASVVRAEEKRNAYLLARGKQDEAKAQLDTDEGLADVEAIEAEIAQANQQGLLAADRMAKSESQITELQNQIAELRKQLEKDGDEHERYLQRAKDLKEKLATVNETKAQRERLLAIVMESLPDNVTDDEILELKAKRDAARKAIQDGEVIRRAAEQIRKARRLETEAVELDDNAAICRELARSTDTVLESALLSQGFDQIKISDGRLCVETDRGLEPVSELSHGERWKFALELAAAGLPKGSVLPVQQQAFEALDPGNRSAISNMARRFGLVIITAEASSGDLRAEVYTDDETEAEAVNA